MLRTDQMWYKAGNIVSLLTDSLQISTERALELFYTSKTCDDLHLPETGLYTYSDRFLADEVMAEYRGL